jgi:hypothetical protein
MSREVMIGERGRGKGACCEMFEVRFACVMGLWLMLMLPRWSFKDGLADNSCSAEGFGTTFLLLSLIKASRMSPFLEDVTIYNLKWITRFGQVWNGVLGPENSPFKV